MSDRALFSGGNGFPMSVGYQSHPLDLSPYLCIEQKGLVLLGCCRRLCFSVISLFHDIMWNFIRIRHLPFGKLTYAMENHNFQ